MSTQKATQAQSLSHSQVLPAPEFITTQQLLCLHIARESLHEKHLLSSCLISEHHQPLLLNTEGFSKVLPAGLTVSDTELAASRRRNSFADISPFLWELPPQVASSEDAAGELQGIETHLVS